MKEIMLFIMIFTAMMIWLVDGLLWNIMVALWIAAAIMFLIVCIK